MKKVSVEGYREIDALIHEFCFKRCPYLGDVIDPKTPHYSTCLATAFQLAEKYGLALIPQSDGIGRFRWLATDIKSVSYTGNSVQIYQKEDVNGENLCSSTPSAATALALAALLCEGVDVDAGQLIQ